MSTTASEALERGKCVFCKICDDLEPRNIVHQDEELVVFPDRKPAAPHHYLVIPRNHIRNGKSLTQEHIPMVERMVLLGREVLTAQGGSTDAAKLGFHWPPFNSINHLHLHVIAPENEMGFLARMLFRSNSFWFVSPESMIQRLQG